MIFQNSLNNVENSLIMAKKLLRPVSLVVYFPDPVFLTHLLAWALVAITILSRLPQAVDHRRTNIKERALPA